MRFAGKRAINKSSRLRLHKPNLLVTWVVLLCINTGNLLFMLFFREAGALHWIVKLTIEIMLCYAVMLAKKNKADAAQSKIISYISRLLKIKPGGRAAKLMCRLDPYCP